jgi:Hemerythrin HHE cation binding domain
MPSDTTNRPDVMWMVAFHSALRRDLAHLARTASRHRSDDPARRRAVLTGWELFKTQLHIHHTGEDTDLWPGMRAQLSGRPDDLALLHAMEDEHDRIDPLADSVDDALADPDHGHERLADTGGPGGAARPAAGGLPPDLAAPLRPPRPLGPIHAGINTGRRGQEQKRIWGSNFSTEPGAVHASGHSGHCCSRDGRGQGCQISRLAAAPAGSWRPWPRL